MAAQEQRQDRAACKSRACAAALQSRRGHCTARGQGMCKGRTSVRASQSRQEDRAGAGHTARAGLLTEISSRMKEKE